MNDYLICCQMFISQLVENGHCVQAHHLLRFGIRQSLQSRI